MKRDLFVYAVSVVVITVSFAATFFLPTTDFYRGLITLPGIAALFSILVQAWRDQRAHERALELQNKQADFTLGIASHMADVVFDKQVTFCEEYAQTLHKAIIELARAGPSGIADEYERLLRDIRTKSSPWLSAELQEKLLPFEMALREIATDHQILKILPVGPERTLFVEKMYRAFTTVIGIAPLDATETPEVAATTIVGHLKDILGISDLIVLRCFAIKTALSRVDQYAKE